MRRWQTRSTIRPPATSTRGSPILHQRQDRAAARAGDALAWYDAGYAALTLTTEFYPDAARLDHAERAFGEALRLASGSLAGYQGLALVHASRRSPELAVDVMRRAVEALPDDADAWFEPGRMYRWATPPRWSEALEALARASTLAPTDAEILILHADSLRAVAAGQRNGELVVLYEKVLALAPGSDAASTARKALAYLRRWTASSLAGLRLPRGGSDAQAWRIDISMHQ